jgi:hypothetical protein
MEEQGKGIGEIYGLLEPINEFGIMRHQLNPVGLLEKRSALLALQAAVDGMRWAFLDWRRSICE